MQDNYNKHRTLTPFDLPSADVDFLAALQKFIAKDAKRRSRIVRDPLSIRIDGVHQRVIDSESWCLLEFEGGTSKVEIVGLDADGEVVIATYLPTYDGPKTEAWKVSLPWGDELSCTFEYDDDECVHVEAKRIVKPKLGEEPAQLTRVPQQGFFRFDRADLERLRNGDPATEHHFTVYFEKLLGIKLRSRSISPDKVEYLKRETFIRVISAVRKGAVQQPERFGAFLNSICNNVLLEYYRTARKNQEIVETRQEIPEMVPDMAFDLEGMMASGEILGKESLITQDQLQKALEFQRANGGTLASCLTRMGFITDDDITGALSRQYGVPSINLKNYEIDPNVIKLIPQETASRYHLIPLSRVGSVLTIAMTDPTNVFAMDDIKFMTGFNVEPVVASEAAIGDAITRFYGGASTNNDQDALSQKFGVAREYVGALVHRAKDKLRSLHALSKPEERQGLDEKSTQDRGQGPAHSSRDKI